MRDTKDDLLYIGNRVYQKTTLLLDLEVIEALQQHPNKTTTEQINHILRKEVLENE